MIHLNINKSAVSVLFTILFATLQTQAVAQYSKIFKYDNIAGDRSLIASDTKGYYITSCSHTSDGRSCFMIENRQNNTTIHFYTSQQGTPAPGVSYCGYIVNDITVDNHDCWFCGTKWVRTGNFIYDTNGLLFPETNFYGYVGRFGLMDVLNGNYSFDITILNNFIEPRKLVVTDGIATIIGGRLIAELTPVGGGQYSYKYGISSHDCEVFMDIVNTGDTIVTLSRYNDINHPIHYKDYFGLRYGTPGNLINTSDTVFNYDVYFTFGEFDTRARFDTVSPIFLCPTGTGSGVTVSYIPTNKNTLYPIYGRLLMFMIPGKNKTISKIIYSYDTCRYTEIKQVKFSPFAHSQKFTAVLLHDSTGRSVLRYPMLHHTPNWTVHDTIKQIASPYVEAILPFINSYTWMKTLYGVGHYANSASLKAIIQDSRIHYSSNQQAKTCFKSFKGILVYCSPGYPPFVIHDDYHINATDPTTVSFTSYEFTPINTITTQMCSGN